MSPENCSTHTLDARRPTGRQYIGLRLAARFPVWQVHQLDALRGKATRAAMLRDAVTAGLFALANGGAQAPGFDPAQAVRDAHARGEPTGTALDER